MRLLKLNLTVLSLVAGAFTVTGVSWSQTEADAVEDELSAVEDTTLDGSGAEAAKAANAVPAPETKISDSAAPAAEAANSEPVAETKPENAKEESQQEAQQQEEEVAAEPAVPPTPVAETPAAPAPLTSDVVMEDSKVKGTYGGRVFGRYKVQLSANKPTFNEGQKCYEKLYGKPQTHFAMSGDWFPLDWWVNPGLMMRMGMYSVRGKAAVSSSSGASATSCDSLVADENSSTTLLFIPLQIGPKIQFSPFSKKWLVLDVWTAAEYGWWQETRDSATAMIKPFSLLASDQVYTNTGRKSAISTGVSAHILLNSLDERTVRSMIDTMGIGYVYLTGFMETVKSTSKEGLTFGRNVMGIGFTFETYK